MKQPDRCPHCKHLTVDAWVHRLNSMAREMDEWAASMHPSGWHEFFQDDYVKYRALAQSPTCACEEEITQKALFMEM